MAKYNLHGADKIADYFGVGISTAIITWRRYCPPPPIEQVDGQLCANSCEMEAWLKDMNIKTPTRGARSHGRTL